MRTTVANLIKTALDTGNDTTASDGRWKCRINKDVDAYIVTHHTTDMIIYGGPNHNRPGWVFPLDKGWGSQTDKQGINAMLQTVGSDETYRSLFYEDSTGSLARVARDTILDGIRAKGCTYTDVEAWYDGDPVLIHDGACPVHEGVGGSDEPPPNLEPFTPPLRVEDSIL